MLISLLVKPGSKQSPRLERLEDGSYVAFLRERPHDGEANALTFTRGDIFRLEKSLALGKPAPQ